MSSLSVGDIAPRFVQPDDAGIEFDLGADSVAGRHLALVFCPDKLKNASGELRSFADDHDAILRLGAKVIAVSREPVATNASHRKQLGLPYHILSDCQGVLFQKYGIGSDIPNPITVVLGPNRHVLNILDDEAQAAATLETVSANMEAWKNTASGYHPPLLIVPDVLEPDVCRYLISLYQIEDTPLLDARDYEGLMPTERDFKMAVADYGRRDRVDYVICDNDIQALVTTRLQSRLLPEIKKAFSYEITSFEGLRVAHYEGERHGKAHGHRDNSIPEAAHRRFALSINLNTESFEGGELHFPEYGAQRYRPETGAAIVFSCSLLHEALEVRKGERFVVLAFLFGDH